LEETKIEEGGEGRYGGWRNGREGKRDKKVLAK